MSFEALGADRARASRAGRRIVPSGMALVAALALLGTVGRAADPPHWSSTTLNVDCTSQCHVAHHALGGGLNPRTGNVNLCQSCHKTGGLAGDLPISSADLAQPALERGVHHAFDIGAVHPGLQTQAPLNAQMLLRVMDGNVVCSTCHNQHAALATLGGAARVSPAKRTTALASTGAVTSSGTFSGAQGVWYLIEIVAPGNESSAQFRYSKDRGTSWFPPAGTLQAGPVVPLDSGVAVGFGAGSFVVGERWEFYGSWPFLRAPLDQGANAGGDAFCRDCHRSWVMDSVATWDGSVKSHPVGVTLTGGAGYFPVPLDANGQAQGGVGADANASNDLRLDAQGRVQCLTCHGVHYADSNSLTEDGP